jgi:copper homeostasis protein
VIRAIYSRATGHGYDGVADAPNFAYRAGAPILPAHADETQGALRRDMHVRNHRGPNGRQFWMASNRRAATVIDIVFEACVESLDEAREAAAWGADRVELCIDLAHDGCTPPRLLVAECVAVGIPVIAMVRPRRGDFVYTRAEIDVMCDSVHDLAACGAAGFATGALRHENQIDIAAMARLVAAAGALPVTFHRAFDQLGNADDALETLVELGVRRVLTSGGAVRAVDGVDALRRLVDRAAGRIEIIAAGGIRSINVDRIIAVTGVPAVHARWSAWR